MMQPVNGVPVAFVNVTDRERALAFYQGVLGLTVRSSDGFGDFLQLDGALLRVTALPDHKAHPHPVLGWNVDDIVTTAGVLRDRGVIFTVYDGIGQDEQGIWTAPDGTAKVAWFSDPDGNVLSISQA